MKRRDNGEGSVYQRSANGRWEGSAYVTNVDGTRERKTVSGKTREIAKARLKALQDQEARGIRFSDQKWKVGEYLDHWLHEIHAKDIRETTFTNYSNMINKHLKPTMGGHNLRDLAVSDIRRALDEMERRGASARTRVECLRVLSVCLNYAMSEEGGELVSRNVAQLVKKPRYTPEETVIWSERQAVAFLQSVKEHPLYIAFLLVLVYGLRSGEVLGLRYSDIDFENELIHVRQQISRVRRINGRPSANGPKNELVARELKTQNSRRTLPLTPNVRQALLQNAEKCGHTITPFNPYYSLSLEDTIVRSSVGTPMEPRNFAKSFDVATKRAGLPRIKVHAMRHTESTMLKDLGVPIKDAQMILGHSDATTTMKFYQHGTHKTQRDAISAVEERLIGE